MNRTKVAFINAQRNGLIKMVNSQIKSVYLEGDASNYKFVIELQTSRNSTMISLPVSDIYEFIKIFIFDEGFDIDKWNNKQLIGKYVRLCYYMTPENEMHELADKLEFVGVKNIIDDDPHCACTYIEK